MIDISIEINGKKVNPNNMKDAMEGMIISGMVDSVTKSVQGLRCPEHGDSPKLKVKGRNIDNLNIEVLGCCETLIEEVKKTLQ